MSSSSTVVQLTREAPRDRINALVAEQAVTQAQVAREAGVSQTTLSRYLKDDYDGDNQAVARKLTTWLAAFEDRQSSSAALPEGPEFVETSSSERVIATLRYAQVAADMVAIYGGAGVGKTRGIAEYARRSPNVWHVTMTPASSGVLASLGEIAEALGERDLASSSRMFKSIVRRVRGTHGLLVIDEAQHLTTLALDQIRSIHDAANVGIALVGNETVYARMDGGHRAAFLDRLRSRIGKFLYLKKSTAADIEAFASAWGVNDPACLATVKEVASKPGALRVLAKVLRLATMHAHAASMPVCCDHVRAAWRELDGGAA